MMRNAANVTSGIDSDANKLAETRAMATALMATPTMPAIAVAQRLKTCIHGTHVAGTIGRKTNDRVGVAAHDVTVIPCAPAAAGGERS